MEIRNKKADETSVWAFAVPEINPFAFGKKRKQQEKMINILKGQDGFIGVHPMDGAVLCLYKTENDAKRARNLIEHESFITSKGVAEVYIKTETLENAEKMKKEMEEKGS